jgi:tetratricopeptide (TPR) repeat protein
MLEREPEDRPASAREVRDVLLAIRRGRAGRWRRGSLAAAAAVAVLAVGVSAWLYTHREPAAGEQVKVVLGAMENGSGEPTLDAVPGLLAAALDPSPRVKLVPGGRLALVARQAGLGEPGRLDPERGRTLARLAGAAVVLVPSAWKEDGEVMVAARAIESETGRVLFTASLALARPQALAATVDHLSDRIRSELNERDADRRIRRPVAEMVTASPEAARYYYEGVDCLDGARVGYLELEVCSLLFEKALGLDPSFALAQYQLASIRAVLGAVREEYRPYLDAALRAADRLPSREATLVRALAAGLDGRADEAVSLYDAVLASSPEDIDALRGAAKVQIERGDWRSALGYVRKWVEVAPEQQPAVMVLVEVLGRLGRRDDLRALMARLKGQRSVDPTSALVDAHLWLGEPEAAVEVARHALEERGEIELPELRYALNAAGRFEEMEEVAKRIAGRPGADPWHRYFLILSLAARGRVEQALRLADDTAGALPATKAAETHFIRALVVAVTWDGARVWRDAARAFAIDPSMAAELDVTLALMGDLSHAAQLAKSDPPGTVSAEEHAALVAWRSGNTEAALARLIALEARDPWPATGLPPAYLVAEICGAASGREREALAAVARFRALPPRGFWRAFAYPRSLIIEASAHARLGERSEASRAVDELLRIWSRADPGLSLLREARALRESL